MEINKRLILQYPETANSNAGQHVFRSFEPTVSNDQLFDLAEQINSFQADTISNVLVQRVIKIT